MGRPWWRWQRDLEPEILVELQTMNRRLAMMHASLDASLHNISVQGGLEMAIVDDILAKVTEQKGIIASVKVLVAELKANQGNPTVLADIVDRLNENTVELAVIANPDDGTTPAPSEPTPTEPTA